jgi:hypothetical protein
MQRLCVRGVVKGGQVVLEVPLDLPDGTDVTVTDGAIGVNEPAKPNRLPPSEEYKRNLLTALNRLDLMDDPDWQAKAEPDRIAYGEKLILEAAELCARREAAAGSEQQTSRSRGARE